MNQPTHLDLFSGIGGFALAAQWAGFRTVGFSEIDPYASAVLKKHWPDVPNYGDVRTVPAIRCDLLTGGFPCQPFSNAGKRKGKADDRYLWPAMFGVISRCRPIWVVGENVTGIVNLGLESCIADLESKGYQVQTFIIPACAVDAQHRRSRVWIVANSESNNGRTGLQESGSGQFWRRRPCDGNGEEGEATADADNQGMAKREGPAQWLPEPDVGRVANGIPNRVDRLKCLGNAIVPQVAFQILKAIRTLI